VATTDEDEDIRLKLIAGGEADIRDAFERIDKEFRVPICAWVRKRYYPGMSADDMADMWQDTMRELLKQVRDGKYDGDRAVFSDLCQIISRNTIDLRRKHKTRDPRYQIGHCARHVESLFESQKVSRPIPAVKPRR
jgi:DNA-directed RNA polymerase specialized sigma24 family protein